VERPEAAACDPLVTNALIDLRWHQRRRLQYVPDQYLALIFDEQLMPPTPPKLSMDRSGGVIVESSLRLAAQRIKNDGFDVTLEQFAEDLFRFLNENWYPSTKTGDHPLRHLRNDAQEALKHDVPVLHSDALLGYVLLVLWADDLADDYTDPRVKMQREEAAQASSG
jgi:hypothetical protein